MLVQHEVFPNIWDFALAFYALPDVQADCLKAQDEFGLDVTTLIFALYRAHRSQSFDVHGALALAQSLSVQITQPLRQIRIALKTPAPHLDPHKAASVRALVKQAELESERLTLETLDQMPFDGAPLGYEAALKAMALLPIHRQRQDLEALLKRLAMAAQNV